MKKLFLIISFIFIAFAASSYSISEETATKLASHFFGGCYATSTSSVKMVSNGLDHATKGVSEAAPYYIFNHDGGGYVIIAGEDAMKPVIGYSYTGHIDVNNMSYNLQWWLDGVSVSVNHIRARGIMPTRERLAEWNSVGFSTKAGSTSVVNLNTVAWNQGAPFNWDCPPYPMVTSKTNCPAGCVPIAVCELMVYYSWPVKGEGTTPAYSGTYDVAANTLGTEYDWTMFKEVYADANGVSVPGSNTMARKANKDKVARFVGDVGKSVQADYGLDGTGAHTEDIVRLFTQYFKYNKAARYLVRASYGDAEWESMLKAELDKKQPVLYSGQGADGGHQFIFDGYNSDGYFHVNWGWGRDNNGFFWINYDFRYNQGAIFDFIPDEDGSSVLAKGDIRVIRGIDTHNGYQLTSSAAIEKDVPFTMTVASIANNSCNVYTRDRAMRLARVGSDGAFKEYCSTTTTILSSDLYPAYYLTSAISFSNQRVTGIEMGDKIVLYRVDASGNWGPAEVNKDGSVLTGYSLVRNEFIDVKESYHVGDKFETALLTALTPYSESSRDNSRQYTSRWKFYKDGVLKAEFNKGSQGTYMPLDEAGNWTVVVVISLNGVPQRSVTAAFEVN